eukprot:6213062-Pleurochrysis_carterae.AAC.2
MKLPAKVGWNSKGCFAYHKLCCSKILPTRLTAPTALEKSTTLEPASYQQRDSMSGAVSTASSACTRMWAEAGVGARAETGVGRLERGRLRLGRQPCRPAACSWLGEMPRREADRRQQWPLEKRFLLRNLVIICCFRASNLWRFSLS